MYIYICIYVYMCIYMYIYISVYTVTILYIYGIIWSYVLIQVWILLENVGCDFIWNNCTRFRLMATIHQVFLVSWACDKMDHEPTT